MSGVLTLSTQALIRLQNIEFYLKKMSNSSFENIEYGKTADWTFAKKGNIYEYQREVTMTGAAQTIDLAVPFACMIRRWDTWTDDATAKSYTLDVLSGNVTPTSYTRLDNVAADTNQSNSFTSDRSDSYLQIPIILRTSITASTNGKKMTIKILVER